MDDGTQWYKRWRMQLSPLPRVVLHPLPAGFTWLPWSLNTIEAHAVTKQRCFVGELDALVFPSLGTHEGCLNLMHEIARHAEFCPAATWLIVRGGEYCGTVQALAGRNRVGMIQNLGVVPRYRGLGLGTALLKQALHGFWERRMRSAFLEVTAENDSAVRLYRKWGFRCRQTVYKSVTASARITTTVATVNTAPGECPSWPN